MLRPGKSNTEDHKTFERSNRSARPRKRGGSGNGITKRLLIGIAAIGGVLFLIYRWKFNGRGYDPVVTLKKKLRHKERAVEHRISEDRSLVLAGSLYDQSFHSLNRPDGPHGEPFDFSIFKGMVSLVINVACAWGKTIETYKHIAEMLDKYSEEGLMILAFPTNDFNQEPDDDEVIKGKVLSLIGPDRFNDPGFVLFRKSSLVGNPIYDLLQEKIPGQKVRHNFFKYLISRDGTPVKLYDKKTTLLDMERDIVEQLEIP